jgi:hypothetical protein
MKISTVHDHADDYEVTLTDDTVLWVPKDPLNADYVRVEAWIKDGGEVS